MNNDAQLTMLESHRDECLALAIVLQERIEAHSDDPTAKLIAGMLADKLGDNALYTSLRNAAGMPAAH
jgi:hypothetical protein